VAYFCGDSTEPVETVWKVNSKSTVVSTCRYLSQVVAEYHDMSQLVATFCDVSYTMNDMSHAMNDMSHAMNDMSQNSAKCRKKSQRHS
jgi:methyl-accepting chemotaxis protein